MFARFRNLFSRSKSPENEIKTIETNDITLEPQTDDLTKSEPVVTEVQNKVEDREGKHDSLLVGKQEVIAEESNGMVENLTEKTNHINKENTEESVEMTAEFMADNSLKDIKEEIENMKLVNITEDTENNKLGNIKEEADNTKLVKVEIENNKLQEVSEETEIVKEDKLINEILNIKLENVKDALENSKEETKEDYIKDYTENNINAEGVTNNLQNVLNETKEKDHTEETIVNELNDLREKAENTELNKTIDNKLDDINEETENIELKNTADTVETETNNSNSVKEKTEKNNSDKIELKTHNKTNGASETDKTQIESLQEIIDELGKNRVSIHNSNEKLEESSSAHETKSKFIENTQLSTNDKNIDSNLLNNSSVVVEDLPADLPSPSGDSVNMDKHTEVASGSSTIVVKPINDNSMACNAISQKLTEIAEVAESLDGVIRDVQIDADVPDTSSSSSEKKLENLRSNSSEDWHSRSTEDDSFATASEGNFTPHSHSHSSSFQTASGRTSSFISSGKNSFDASEADDSTFAFDMPELLSPINMSFDGSEHSFLSAQQTSPAADNAAPSTDAAIVYADTDAEELRSQSVTPTPDVASIPVESESEAEACIADAPPFEVLTEAVPMTSVTPEVSTCTHVGSAEQQLPRTNHKPNAAWRRSKYYENITKQTIKGFL